jgi:outer membrane protein TolC
MGLDDVLRTLDARHPLLVAAEQERPLAAGDLQSAEGAFDLAWRTRGVGVPLGAYPSARIDSVVEVPTTLWGTSFFAGYRWGTDTFADYDGKLITNELGEVRAGALVPIWRNGPIDRRRATIERSEIGLALAELTVTERRIELTRLTTLRYWEWVAAGRRLAIAETLLRVARDRDAQLGERVTKGDLPELERIDNQRAILQREQQVISADRSLVQAALELSLYFRDARGEPIVAVRSQLPGDVPAPSEPELVSDRVVAEAKARRPEVARAEGQREQARVERDWAENQRMPAIDLQVLGSQDLGAGDAKRQKFEFEAGVLIDVPIERNVADGRAASARAQLARADAQARFAGDRIRVELRDASSAMLAALERHGVAVRELELARRVEEAERDKLELGDSSLLLVNLREQATFDAALRELEARLDARRAKAAFDAASGRFAGDRAKGR